MKTLYSLLLITLLSLDASAYYKINKLSMEDSVFKNFRKEILFYNTSFKYRLKKLIQSRSNIRAVKLKTAIYKVKIGDNLINIANRSYLSVDTIVSINYITSPYDIFVNKKILIPNMDGTFYHIEKETDLDQLKTKYKLPKFIIASVNNLNRNKLYKGEKVFIPLRKLSFDERRFFNSKIFSRPLKASVINKKGFIKPVLGSITSTFGTRVNPFTNKRTFHGGLDIAAPIGKKVYASHNGKVIFSGWMGEYGQLIIISHKYDYKTFYGHLSKRLVRKGMTVKKGDIIGKVGSTGHSTGPHLHFEVRRYNQRKNPIKFTHNTK